MSATIDDVVKEFDSYRDDVKAKVKALGDTIDALRIEVTNATPDPEKVDALLADVKAAHAALVPAVSEPLTPPDAVADPVAE